MNRSTNSQYVDTILAPFELNPDARRQSGLGLSLGGQAFSRNRFMKLDVLTRVGAHADFFSLPRFNDRQLSLDTGPELRGPFGELRPALVYERRWYGGGPYSRGLGPAVSWVFNVKPKVQIELSASRVWQAIEAARYQSGWRSSVTVDVSSAISSTAGTRFTFRYGGLDARTRAEGIRQFGVGLLFAKTFHNVAAFGQLDLTKTRGLDPIFLFGKARDEHRFDFTAGAVYHAFKIAGFAPLARITYSRNAANISIYDYVRTRVDLGFSRKF